MMKLFRSIFDDIKKGENLDIYITLIVAIVIAVMNLLGNTPKSVLDSLILAVLALLVSSALGVRHRLENLKQQIFQTTKGIDFKDRRQQHEVPFDKRFADAKNIDLHGYSLNSLVASYLGFLNEKAATGCKMRIILLDPESTTPQIVSYLTEAGSLLTNDIQRSVEGLKNLLSTRNVEIRFTTTPTPFGLAIKDSKKANGSVDVDLYAYRVSALDRPKIIISKEIDKHWYEFFVQQFEKLWEDARPYEKLKE